MTCSQLIDLPSRREPEEPWSVPRILWQSWVGRDVPRRMHRAASSWFEGNPELEYRFYDDARMEAFVRADDCSGLSFGEEELVAAFDKVRPPAAKADLFRYLALFRYGGVWADIDSICNTPLRELLEPGLDMIIGFGSLNEYEAFMQYVLVCRPEHPFLRAALERAVRNVLQESFDRGLRHVFALTGPLTLTCAINELLGHPVDFGGYEDGVFEMAGTRVRIAERNTYKSWFWQPYAGYPEDQAARGLKKTYYLPIFVESRG